MCKTCRINPSPDLTDQLRCLRVMSAIEGKIVSRESDQIYAKTIVLQEVTTKPHVVHVVHDVRRLLHVLFTRTTI